VPSVQVSREFFSYRFPPFKKKRVKPNFKSTAGVGRNFFFFTDIFLSGKCHLSEGKLITRFCNLNAKQRKWMRALTEEPLPLSMIVKAVVFPP
jgi:hypothetical protein